MTPNPPTDNLYKFITFLGVALLVFSTWSLGDNLRKMQEAEMISVAETASLDDDVTQLSGNVLGLGKQVADALSGAKILEQEEEPDREKLTRMLSMADQMQIAYDKTTNEMVQIERRQKALRDIKNKSNIVIKSLGMQNYFLYAGIFIGLIMSISGFVAWYLLHQRHQDLALVASLRLDNAKE